MSMLNWVNSFTLQSNDIGKLVSYSFGVNYEIEDWTKFKFSHCIFKGKGRKNSVATKTNTSNNQSMKMNRVLRFKYHSERTSLLTIHQLFINLNL